MGTLGITLTIIADIMSKCSGDTVSVTGQSVREISIYLYIPMTGSAGRCEISCGGCGRGFGTTSRSAILSALPLYVMSCFLLPKAINTKIAQSLSSLWWPGLLVWDHDNKGGFSVASTYDRLVEEKWRNLDLPEREGKIRHYLWNCFFNILLVNCNLLIKQTKDQIFFHHPKAKRTWELALISWEELQQEFDGFKPWWKKFCSGVLE
ncbi:reverse transcriptase [Striga asiatica]|uniref:Reverse transcriptase n=1 Tax=Striga asiatica TaxID=4170 RepID=A0A5A7Q8V2_STRAF|nr:reverse transcriptase [Striga asiatica]